MTSAIVVGSGPNGLAAAITLAQAGVEVTVLEAADEIGGGTRSSDLTGHGTIHDHCSAFHGFARGSAFADHVGLEAAGLRLCQPEIDLAHPLDDGTAAALVRSIDVTAAGLGADGRRWSQLIGPVAATLPDLLEDIFRPVAHVPHHPVTLARYGLRAMVPAAVTGRTFATPQGRGLFGGVAAHGFYPFGRPMSEAVGVALAAAAHAFGWVVAEGGSRAITDVMAKLLADASGTIETGIKVRSLAELPPRDLTILDVAPRAVVEIAGPLLPARVARAYRRWRHGPAAFKLDLVVEGGVPWRDQPSRAAGTVHVGGAFEEIARSERDVWAGRMPERPFVLVGQQYLADPTRSAGNLHPVWTYAHVPNGYTGDAAEAIVDQIERFAPGVRDRIIARHATSPGELEAGNPNYVGGDVNTGANTWLQAAIRPRITLDPYRTGIPDTFLCSAATPPGPGAHGMCGYNAARHALAGLGVAPR